MKRYQPLYSGEGKSGICECGHSWEKHHLCLVAKQEYIDETKEGYIPCECEFYGHNELGGLKPNGSGEYEYHCNGYRDRGV